MRPVARRPALEGVGDEDLAGRVGLGPGQPDGLQHGVEQLAGRADEGLALLVLLLAGGLAYTAGAVIYAIKKPDLLPGRFGFHELFHVFILFGAGFHYFLVLDAVGGR